MLILALLSTAKRFIYPRVSFIGNVATLLVVAKAKTTEQKGGVW